MALVYQYSGNAGLTHIFMDTDQGVLVAMGSEDVAALGLQADQMRAALDAIPAETMTKITAVAAAATRK